MSKNHLKGLIKPQNLTGKVMVDKDQAKFRGNYSWVYLGTHKKDLVAVKIIQSTGKPESMKRKLKREGMIWATMEHPNILPLYGFADDEAFAPFGAFISPWYAKGDASRYLSEHGETMTFNDRIKLWKDVLQGLVYLHEHEPTIIHGDLKPGNILIDDSGTPRICDFGLARIFLEEGHSDMTTTSEHTGTARYLAPELASSDETVYPTTASDVYALGCLALEFIYLQKPYANRVNNLRGQIYMDLRKGLPPATRKPDGQWPSCHSWSLISEMWNIDPICRPSAFIARRTLEGIPFTLPQNIIQRIIFFGAVILGPKGEDVDGAEWAERCGLLRRLCLVSTACREYTLPLLYGKIRLYLRPGHSSFSGLLNTLTQSKGQSRPPKRVYNGYGKHTKSLIIVAASFHLDPWCGTSSVDVRHLLQMMSGLRYIVISTLPMLRFTIATRSISNLEIRGGCTSLLLGEECTLEVLSTVQRVSFIEDRPPPNMRVNFERPVYPSKAFPNLQAIEMQDDNLLLLEWSKTLYQISEWALPRLTSLQVKLRDADFELGYDLVNANEELKAFLGVHGHTIQYLTLMAPTYADDWVVPWVLPKCPNLRSIVIRTQRSTIPKNLPFHLKLETLVVWAKAQDSDSADTTRCLSQVENFRRLSTALLPKLDKAEFKWGVVCGDESTTQVAASFKVGIDDCIVNGVPQYRSLSTSLGYLTSWITPK